jgi:hypothetical protein
LIVYPSLKTFLLMRKIEKQKAQIEKLFSDLEKTLKELEEK